MKNHKIKVLGEDTLGRDENEVKELLCFVDENVNPILRVSPRGEILYANAAAQRMMAVWGVAFNRFMGLFNGSEKIYKNAEVPLGEKAFSFSWAPLPESENAVLIGQDITERKRQDLLKEDFINTVSHEIRIPLTIVKGAVSNLVEGVAGPLTGTQLAQLNIANRNVDRLNSLLRNLLDLARLESGRPRLKYDQVLLENIVEEVLSDFNDSLGKKGIELTQKIPIPLPSAYADSELVYQVLNNLLDNALRFARTKIMLSVEKKKDRLTVTVENDGPSIPVDKLEAPFQKFVQIHSSEKTKGYKGTGLGLAICKEIMGHLRGKIWAEACDSGARFRFTLPVFNAEKNGWENIQDAITRADENNLPLVLLGCSLRKVGRINTKRASEAVTQRLKKTEEIIKKNVLRTTDEVIYVPSRQSLIVISETEPQGGEIIRNRIRKVIPDLNVGISYYPGSGKVAKELVRLAIKD